MLSYNALISFFHHFTDKSRRTEAKPNATNSIYSNLWTSYKSPTYRPFLFPMEFLTRLWVKIKVIVCRFTYFHHTYILSFHIYIPQMLKRKQERIHGNLFQAIDYYSQENLHNKRILLCSQKHSEYAIIEDTKWIYAGDYIVYLLLLRLIIICFFLYLGKMSRKTFTICWKRKWFS